MTIIVCLDDKLGMAFNKRRQSRDSEVIKDIARDACGEPIFMDERSAKLFSGIYDNINIITEDAPTEAIRFIEFAPPSEAASAADRLIIYRWNRSYPADMYFDLDMSCWRQTAVTEFAGSSHEKITKEVYTRE